jgi:pimeloyl-ACP methyl ester carboxylesterase
MVAGRPVAYQRQAGPGGGPEILLLHGAGGSEHTFDALLPCLPFGALVPALPGRSGSEGPPLRSAADAARWIAEFLQVVDLPQFVAVGHSLGGAVALELGLAAASLPALKGLALLSTGARLRVHPDILR